MIVPLDFRDDRRGLFNVCWGVTVSGSWIEDEEEDEPLEWGEEHEGCGWVDEVREGIVAVDVGSTTTLSSPSSLRSSLGGAS
jgi:hypothetical protein